VLVGGVAQIGLGVGQAWLTQDPPARREVRAEVVTWNLSIVATVVGTLGPAAWSVYLSIDQTVDLSLIVR